MSKRFLGISIVALCVGGCYSGYGQSGNFRAHGLVHPICESLYPPPLDGVAVETHWHDANGCMRYVLPVATAKVLDDGDGLKNDRDLCFDAVRGGEVDVYGCNRDGDGDGILDGDDQCPGTPKNAEVNAVGCWVLKNLTFKPGRWNIGKSSAAILDGVATILKGDPGHKVVIEGHTDSHGGAENNRILSQKRAQVVVRYLLGKGITSHRLMAKGMGQSVPIADNATPEGRAVNRRVEIKTLN
ncbi:MAG: OmpA family protein [Magnetococcus sp. THC-1_WYH]